MTPIAVPSYEALAANPSLASGLVTVLHGVRAEANELSRYADALATVLKQYIALNGEPYGTGEAKCLRDDAGHCAILSARDEVRYDIVTAARLSPIAVVTAAEHNALEVVDKMIKEQRATGMAADWVDTLWKYRVESKGGGPVVLSFERNAK